MPWFTVVDKDDDTLVMELNDVQYVCTVGATLHIVCATGEFERQFNSAKEAKSIAVAIGRQKDNANK
jgi:hypothetical protein